MTTKELILAIPYTSYHLYDIDSLPMVDPKSFEGIITRFSEAQVHTFDCPVANQVERAVYRHMERPRGDKDLQCFDHIGAILLDLSPIVYYSVHDFIQQMVLRLILQFKVRPSDIHAELKCGRFESEVDEDLPNIIFHVYTNLDETMCTESVPWMADDGSYNYDHLQYEFFIALDELDELK